jgi:hypothetical protein
MYCTIILPLFLQYLMDIEELITRWHITSKCMWVIPNNWSAFGISVERRVSDKKWTAVVCLDNYFSQFYYPVCELVWQLIPMVRQFFFVPYQLNKLVDLRMQSPPHLNQFNRNLISTWQLISFQLPNSNLNLRDARLWHRWLCCLCLYLY